MKIRRKQRQSKVRSGRWIALFIVTALLVVGVGGLGGFLVLANAWTEDLPDITQKDAFNLAQRSTVYANDGTTVLAEFQIENREPVDSLDAISPFLVDATVATEDSRFYEHNGVDLFGIARAVISNLFGGELEGASTITQQLVRNTLLSDEARDITLKRKVREAALALEMEQLYTKDEILLMYLNTINYGDGCYGIEAASQHYFSKHASELTLPEAATLAGIPQSPSYLNPVYYPDACQNRRNSVLTRMVSYGAITEEQQDEATNTPLTLELTDAQGNNGIYLYPYFTSYVRDVLLEQYTTAEIFAGGLKIYTTLDIDMQDAAEAACEEQCDSMDDAYECALVAVDPNTGFIKALVGGKDFEKEQFNIAVQKGRPTGSSFKAFTLTAAISAGISPSTKVNCTSPATITGKRIENFANINYGVRTIASMTAVSSNTGFARLQQEVGTQNVIEMARRLGVKKADLPAVTSLTLGVADITPLEMAQAYGTLASGGIYHEAVPIERIVDKHGNEIYKAETEGERVIDSSIAGAVTDVLQGVFYGEGTASGYALADGRPVAGKTGTSEDFRDHTLIGYTPQLVCATWIGDRYNVYASDSVNCNWLFKEFMDEALWDYPIEDFPAYTAPSYNHSASSILTEGTKDEDEEEEKKKAEEEEARKKAEEEAQQKAMEEAQQQAQQGGDTPGGDTPGGDTPGGETPGGDTPGGETPGGGDDSGGEGESG